MKAFVYFLINTLFTLLGLVLVIFIIGHLIPTDPVIAIIGDRASEALYLKTRHELGLDLPLYTQFWNYCKSIMRGDWGRSLLSNQLVLDDIKLVFPATIELATSAMLIGVGIGIPLGISAALYKNSIFDHIARIISLMANSLSIFWLALMGLLVFYVKLDWAPSPGRFDLAYEYIPKTGFILLDSILNKNWELLNNALSHLLLPALILGFYKIGHISRMTRAFVLEEINQDYVTTALIKGLSIPQVLLKHILPNIFLPLITIIALSYGTLLEGSTFIETIFMWPGLGFYLSQALMNADLNAVLGATLVIGIVFIAVNKIADGLYKWMDPRI
ncbi:MAG: binding-protein-dependent transport system inner rane component [Francisellaceae bacterium]|nr:binding-protein-dependent transport system inner rane component [Francisellaceae bacterium]